jgi:branched-chain amino acid transport system permease protein
MAMLLLLVALALVPLASSWAGDSYYVTLFTRVLVFAIAACGLNIALGYGGMISFGHALYVAIGAYAVGIASTYGLSNGWIQLGLAVVVAGGVSFLVGFVCLRTSGMVFIMITLAFAQMFYFFAVSIKAYGGDEGISIAAHSQFWPFPALSHTWLYYGALLVLAIVLWFTRHLVGSRFGMVLIGSRLNAQRLRSLGFPTLRYRLAAYMLSAMICAVAGVLLANLTRFVSPSFLDWPISGDLIIMIVLGGLGSVLGPVFGAAGVVLLEEVITNVSLPAWPGLEAFAHTHWKIALGVLIVGVAMWGHREGRKRSPEGEAH